MRQWLLLVYSVPRSPTSSRVYVWRKLKGLGAVLFQDSVWLLPSNARTKEHFQWLCEEIRELKGKSSVWEGQLLSEDKDKALEMEFSSQIDESYTSLLRELRKRKADISSLAKKFQFIRERDYFNSALGPKVREKLVGLKGRTAK